MNCFNFLLNLKYKMALNQNSYLKAQLAKVENRMSD